MDMEENTAPDAELRERLTPEQYRVTQEAGTEPAFTGLFWNAKTAGMYKCVVCLEPLFHSDTKFDSGTGWPSFTAPAASGAVTDHDDSAHGMVRTENRCANCGAHLGHVFPDGPGSDGLRYCINSASLELHEDDAEDESED
jgi:peptide-methionine (R)-S-oxide reductase